jgi:ADP-ribosylglycohydrolase
MKLDSAQRSRSAGVLLGQAIGDALGVPYEGRRAPIELPARMKGGGYGPYRPGEYSDDTQMAVCIAQVAATGADLAGPEAIDAVAQRFSDWDASGATDKGMLTNAVIARSRAGTGSAGDRMNAASADEAGRERRNAGNGALMRTGIVGLTRLADRHATAAAAQAMAALTHAAPLNGESAVLWSEAVRVAVVEGRLDVRAGLDLLEAQRADFWAAQIDQAEEEPPAAFARNGFTVTALQAAWSAIHHTRHIAGPDGFEAALQLAISIGHDTDTVAAIAGTLLGAYYGVPGIPSDLARRVHGWPGLGRRDLMRLALAAARGGRPPAWPGAASLIAGYGNPLGVPHPFDAGVCLGTEDDLFRQEELGFDAVVSMSMVGDPEIAASRVLPQDHAEVWLIDSEDPADNPCLEWTLADAARTVQALRAEDKTVLLHCVGAQHRTPAAALAYARLLGHAGRGAAQAVEKAIGHPCGGLLWRTATNCCSSTARPPGMQTSTGSPANGSNSIRPGEPRSVDGS